MAFIERPAALPAAFELQTLDDVDAALHELSWCRNRGSALDAATKAKIEALKTAQEGLRGVTLWNGEASVETTIDARAEALEAALLAWGEEHLAEHLVKGSKTLKLPHGELAFKQQPLAVSLNEGVKEAGVIATIDKKTKLLSLAAGLLKKIALGVFRLDQLVRLTPSLDKDAIKTAWEQHPKSRGTIKGMGVTVTGGDDAVCVSPSKLTVSK